MEQLFVLFLSFAFLFVVVYSMRDHEFERNKKEEKFLGLDHKQEARRREMYSHMYKDDPERLEKWRNEEKESRKRMLEIQIISEMTDEEYEEYIKNKKRKTIKK
jgi:hypothetical protein